MEYTNKGSSVYHEVQTLYLRSLEGELLYAAGKTAEETRRVWPSIWEHIELGPTKRTLLPDGSEVDAIDLSRASFWVLPERIESSLPQMSNSEDPPDHFDGRVQELHRPGKDHVIGLLSFSPPRTDIDADFRDWFTMLVLSETRFSPPENPFTLDVEQGQDDARRIADLFEKKLRNVAPMDEWTESGRDFFEHRVLYFTERKARVEFCLPAFPCKSSNREKTSGQNPDKAEELALERLHEFASNVAQTYEPGAKVWIISDGHVFADCSKCLSIHHIPSCNVLYRR